MSTALVMLTIYIAFLGCRRHNALLDWGLLTLDQISGMILWQFFASCRHLASKCTLQSFLSRETAKIDALVEEQRRAD